MELIQIRHAWPEKENFINYKPNGRDDITFLHFFNSVTISINGVRYTTKPNACLFYAPNSPQWFTTSVPLVHDWMHIDSASLETVLSYGIEMNRLYYPNNTKFITSIFQELESEFFTNSAYKDKFIDAKLTEFLVKFNRSCRSKREVTVITDSAENLFIAARREIILNLNEAWDIGKMARLTNLSPSRFHTVYKSLFGTSPINDLIHARINAAQNLLASTNLSIAKICEETGYENVCHFARQFKKTAGMTPGEYRKKNHIQSE